MGVLSLTDPTKLRAFTTLPEVSNLTDQKAQPFIDRAEYIASRIHDYDSSLPAYSQMMEYAIDMLTENLVVMSIPSFKRSAVAKLRAEQIGSYSYSKDVRNGMVDPAAYITPELELILNSYKVGTDPRNIYSTTFVFTKRSASYDQTGQKWYVSEDASVIGVATQDPAIPLEALRQEGPIV